VKVIAYFIIKYVKENFVSYNFITLLANQLNLISVFQIFKFNFIALNMTEY